VDSIKLFLDKGISIIFTATDDSAPLHVSVGCGNLEQTKFFIEKRAALNNTKNMASLL
jgi:ankyrin repeat protein